MIVKMNVFDEHIYELLNKLDASARAVDGAKYGLPLDREMLRSLVYSWLYEGTEKYKSD